MASGYSRVSFPGLPACIGRLVTVGMEMKASNSWQLRSRGICTPLEQPLGGPGLEESCQHRSHTMKGMRYGGIAAIIFLGLAGLPQRTIAASTIPDTVAGYPLDLPLCPASQNLQACLNSHGKVRLENVDYTKVGVNKDATALTVQSGNAIYGMVNTVLSDITLPAGTNGVVLSGFRGRYINLAAGAPISGNLFMRVVANVQASNALVEQNSFIRVNGKLSFDNSHGGYTRNNRFIGCHLQSAFPALTLLGNDSTPSFGNVFLSYSLETPAGNATVISRQTDLTFVGLAAEGWNLLGKDPTWAPMLNVQDSGSIRVFATIGRTDDTVAKSTSPYMSLSAREVQLIDSSASSVNVNLPKIPDLGPWNKGNINTHILNANERSWSSNYLSLTSTSTPEAGKHFDVLHPPQGADMSVNGQPIASASSDQASIQALLDLFHPKSRAAVNWEEPEFENLPNPAGSDWRQLVAKAVQNQVDNSDEIQAEIDHSSDGIAYLKPGIYYIKKPLKLRQGQGIVGSGMGKTLILALSDTIDMIVPETQKTTSWGTVHQFILSDLTLQGGQNGLHQTPVTGGFNYTAHEVFLSHVQFRDMRDSGILADNILGWDNNFLDHLAFVNCQTGFHQSVSNLPMPKRSYSEAEYSPDKPNLSYMDKTVFYKAQFIGNKLAVDVRARRTDNLDAWVYSLFQNNSDGALAMHNSEAAIIARSVFINNGGDAVISSGEDGSLATPVIAGSRFQAGPMGKAFLSGGMTVEGTTFSLSGGSKQMTVLGSRGPQQCVPANCAILSTSFYNSKSLDVPLGTGPYVLSANSSFPGKGGDRFLNVQRSGSTSVIVNQASSPTEQLLVTLTH